MGRLKMGFEAAKSQGCRIYRVDSPPDRADRKCGHFRDDDEEERVGFYICNGGKIRVRLKLFSQSLLGLKNIDYGECVGFFSLGFEFGDGRCSFLILILGREVVSLPFCSPQQVKPVEKITDSISDMR